MATAIGNRGTIVALACVLLPATAGGAPPAIEGEIASLRLGGAPPPKLRCSKAVPTEIETIHQFRGAHLGVDGRDAFLVVTTECLKEACESDAERAIMGVWIQSTPIDAPICPLDPSVFLTTSRGLRLGDPVARVGELYGKPHRATPRKGPLRRADYAGRLRLAAFDQVHVGFTVSFRDGRVDGMTIYVDTDPH